MGFLDDVSSSLARGVNSASRSASTAKLNNHINQLLRQRQTYAAQLGASLYEVTRNDPQFVTGREQLYQSIADIDAQCQAIQQQIDQIKAEEAAASVYAQPMQCPQCGATVYSSNKFCSGCGMPVEQIKAMYAVQTQVQTHAAAPTSGAVCSVCGQPIMPGDKFCMNCGTPYVPVPAPAPAPAPAPVLPVEPVPAPVPMDVAEPAAPFGGAHEQVVSVQPIAVPAAAENDAYSAPIAPEPEVVPEPIAAPELAAEPEPVVEPEPEVPEEQSIAEPEDVQSAESEAPVFEEPVESEGDAEVSTAQPADLEVLLAEAPTKTAGNPLGFDAELSFDSVLAFEDEGEGEEPPAAQASEPVCPTCGMPHRPGDKFCMNCGTKLV